ncbi:23S rRNA (uracil(1939)-C(5))-methyltransferase RlmD [Croceiramulus getboli]|nr:23S rRNA (uracil(1939)-C(5))-methyltransferase RlmD [Flavobacteriaceae bacterium YJPT1-3]
MGRRKSKPILEHLEVIDAGAKGKAIARSADGRVVFISNAVPGDVVDVQTNKKRKNYFEGKAIHFHSLSRKRTQPQCQHFGVCGGCKWQNMDYQYQLEYKEREVIENLKRIGKVTLPEVSPIMGCEEPYYYRNKMEFSFSDSKWLTPEQIASDEIIENKNALGFHIPGMWDKILDIEQCHLQRDPSNAIRNELRRFATAQNLSFFNPRHQHGLLRTLMIRTSTTGELMVLVQFYEDHPQQRELVMNHLKNTFPEITSLLYVINQKGNDTLYDQEVICYHGRDHILESMEGLQFKINAKSFYQTNSKQAYALYQVTRALAGLSGKELVYDLYTGTGTIAQFVAKQAAKVIGVEAVLDAIEAAKENAQLNGIDNVEFFVGDMKNVFNDDFISTHGRPEVVITDPPRDGMHKDVVAQLLKIHPERIVYVSCNSATQARDLALLDEAYVVKQVQPVDMFPQTHHVENVVLLQKRKTHDA